MKFPPLIFAFSFLILLACENDIAEVQRYFDESEVLGETATDVEMLYSDSAVLRAKVMSPELITIPDAKNPGMDFPSGIQLEFFDEYKRVTSWLSAKRATRYEKKELTIVRDSVVFENKSGEVMKTEELFWDEKKGIVYTNRFIKFIKPNGDIIYGYGFSTNETFTRYEIYNGDGLLNLEGLQQSINK